MTELIGTEKQIAYAGELKERTVAAINRAIDSIKEYSWTEQELGDYSEEEIAGIVFSRDWGGINLECACRMFRKEPILKNQVKSVDKVIRILELAKAWGEKQSSAKWWIDNAGVGTATIFVANFAKVLKISA